LEADLPVELVRLERLTRLFTARTHWELSTTLTTNHLLAIIAMANTLMSMNNATFVPEQERTRKLHRLVDSVSNTHIIFMEHKYILLHGITLWCYLCMIFINLRFSFHLIFVVS
jgi:hypothetical protein